MSRINELQLSRICVSLQADEKGRRKKALEELCACVSEGDWSTVEYTKIWEIVSKQLARSLTDEAEYCRNLTIEMWKKFLTVLPIDEKNIVYLLTILSRRLSAQELLEPSEEVRLNCVILLRLVVGKYGKHLAVYYDDFVAVLARTVTDNYPEIKRETCRCIEELAQLIPEQFYSRSASLVKPTLTNFTHQHWKVRVASIRAIGQILLYGNSKSMEDVATPMAERLFDQSGAVRLAVIEVAGVWFLELRDRYSWWHKLLPLLVTGLHDEVENIRNRAGVLWREAGELYARENESDEKFKDKLDFLTEDPAHYPANVGRPNLGCRTIVQQNLCKLVAGISRELGDWLGDIRVRSAQLLCVLVLNAEDHVTQHMEKLLPAMYRACNDEDPRVVINVELAAEYMGYFVPPSIYCHLVLPTLEEVITAGHLRVFAGILRGSERPSLQPKLHQVANFLQQPHVCRSKKSRYQEQLARCCESLVKVCQKDCVEIAQELFTVLFTLVSTCQEAKSLSLAENLLGELARLEDLSEPDEFFVAHLRPILTDLQDSCEAWTIHSAQLQIFRVCLTQATLATSRNTDVVLPILRTTMSNDSDPELRLKLFILLANYFQQRNVTMRHIEGKKVFVDSILRDVIIPGLVWSAGRAAEAIRTAAIGCLCALLDDGHTPSRENTDGAGKKSIVETIKLDEPRECITGIEKSKKRNFDVDESKENNSKIDKWKEDSFKIDESKENNSKINESEENNPRIDNSKVENSKIDESKETNSKIDKSKEDNSENDKSKENNSKIDRSKEDNFEIDESKENNSRIDETKENNSKIDKSKEKRLVIDESKENNSKIDKSKEGNFKIDESKENNSKIDESEENNPQIDNSKVDNSKIDESKETNSKIDKSKEDNSENDKSKENNSKIDRSKEDNFEIDESKENNSRADETKDNNSKIDKSKENNSKIDKSKEGNFKIDESKENNSKIDESEENNPQIDNSKVDNSKIDESKETNAKIDKSKEDNSENDKSKENNSKIDRSKEDNFEIDESKENNSRIDETKEIKKRNTRIEKSKKSNFDVDESKENNSKIDKSKEDNFKIVESKKNNSKIDESEENNPQIDNSKVDNSKIDKSKEDNAENDESKENNSRIDTSKEDNFEINKSKENNSKIDESKENNLKIDISKEIDPEIGKSSENKSAIDKSKKNNDTDVTTPRNIKADDEPQEDVDTIESKKKKETNQTTEGVDLLKNPEDFSDMFEKMIPVLVSLVDDNAKKTRLYALRAIRLMINIARKLSLVSNDRVNEIYPVVLKRLDDGCDDVRIAAATTLVVIWSARTESYDIVFSRSHVDFLYTSAIVHLDDPDENFQSLMLDALIELGKVHPELLAEKIENCKGNFRNQSGLGKLLKHCHRLLRENNV